MTALVLTHGCSPRYADTSYHSDETLCEQSLQQLDALIENKTGDPSLSPGAVAEAKELRRAAAGLYLNGDFELALELIDEAFALLRGKT